MSVYVVRNKMTRYFLRAPGVETCVGDFREAHLFTSLGDAQREAAKYPSWREVVSVRWETRTKMQSDVERPRLVRLMRVVQW